MDHQDVANWSFPVAPILQHAYEFDLPAAPTSNNSSGSQKRPSLAAMACLQCRARKVRCDAGQPRCQNCTRRSEDCDYIVRKQRGPDKQPGTRVRTWRRKPAGYIDPQVAQKAKRRKNEQFEHLHRAMPEGVRNTTSMRSVSEDFDSVSPPSTNSLPNDPYPVLFEHHNTSWDLNNTASYTPDIEEPIRALGSLPHTPLYPSSTQTNHVRYGPSRIYNDIPRGPSVIFNKDTWWDNLLQMHCEDPSQSAQKILQDVTFLFNNTTYWYSFINLPLLLEKLCDPLQRTNLQPSIVFSSLALSVLMKSSETGLGDRGRRHALMLRDAAQSSLEASISAGWIEPSLAQAALLLALFEASAHPYHTSSRTTSAIYLMDSLIRALGLLILDVHEPTVSIFPVDEIPVTSTNNLSLTLQPGRVLYSGGSPHQSSKVTCACPETSSDVVHLPFSHTLGMSQDWDEEFAESLLRPLPSLQSLDILEVRQTLRKTLLEIPPDALHRVWDLRAENDGDGEVILKQPYWPDLESKAEIQKEELRRLCWSALIVTTNLTEFTPYLDKCGWDLHIMKQENFAIFFPGESRSHSPNQSYSSKDTIWGLHCRSILLWNVSQKLRQRPDWDSRKAEFSGRAWMEASAIESALSGHTCSVARGALHPVREFLFQLKLLISNNFTRFIPLPHTLTFERNSAEEWLLHRAGIACHVRKVVYFITKFGAGPAALTLAKRPLSIWWTFYQIRAGTVAWKSDRSLKYALENSLDFVALADFMIAMWPSPGQQSYYSKLKKELAEACVMAGVSIPASVPIPGLPHRPEAAIAPSSLLPRLPASADIPILPLD